MNATEVSTIISTNHSMTNNDRSSSNSMMNSFQEHKPESSHIIKEKPVEESNNYHSESIPEQKNISHSKEDAIFSGNAADLENNRESSDKIVTEQVQEKYTLSSDTEKKNNKIDQEEVSEQKDLNLNMEDIQSNPIHDDSSEILSSHPSNMSPLIKEQLKYCANIVRSLKRNRDASIFLQPVDPVALGIPDYFDVVKSPMDLGTISNKLSEYKYDSPDLFIDDLKLMLSNCFAYNQPTSVVHAMGKNVEKVFENLLKKMPTAAPVTPSKLPTQTVALEEPEEERPRRSLAGAKRRPSLEEDRTLKQRKESLGQSPSALARSTSHVRRKSNSSPSASTASSAVEDLKYCHYIIKELTKKNNQTSSWPFLQPVDPIALGIPDYLTVIKHPMDISTIKRKLDMKSYSTADDFKTDFYLMCQNCYTYNTPDTEVVRLCKTMENMFNEMWSKRPAKNIVAEMSDADDEKILSIKRKIEALEAEIEEIRRRKGMSGKRKSLTSTPTVTNSISTTTTPLSGKKGKPGRPSGSVKKEKSAESYRPMTFEEKRQLSLDINDLPQERLGKVVEIIHACMPRLKESTNSDEIELDIDQLDAKTLHALAKYVKQVKTGKLEEKKSKHPDISSMNTPSKSARPGASQGLNLSSSEDESNDEY